MKWDEKYLSYIVYSVFIALIFIVIYQLTSSHRIVLLQRATIPPEVEQPQEDQDDTEAAPEAS